MKKYLRLSCTVCKRRVDKLVDLTHYAPDQCTITLACEGRLQPIEYLSSGGIAVTPEAGVVDWRPRNTTVTGTYADKEPALVNLVTGSLNQLVIAVPLPADPLDTAKKVVQMQSQVGETKVYRQYIFRKEGAFNSLAGVEEGLEKKSLRFTAYGATPDRVEVYVNGVKKERGIGADEFQLYNGLPTSPVPPNTILFNSSVDSSSATQIDVIVSKESVATNISLIFSRNIPDESRLTKGAFENISYVTRLESGVWKKYWLFTLDLEDAPIPLNSVLQPIAMDGFFLLARAPYSTLDRYLDTVALFRGWSDTDFIKYYAEDSVATIRVTDSALTTFYPPMRLGKFSVEKTIRSAIAGVEEQVIIDGKVITGPNS